ncbi:kielin/chordin-like protein [Tachypleus tridentatus]|uniref:kielin/chordin-like protein n=1 Tax=Tachypleus tridentatus TaxID=6853 RepID=UPI003FD4A4C6
MRLLKSVSAHVRVLVLTTLLMKIVEPSKPGGTPHHIRSTRELNILKELNINTTLRGVSETNGPIPWLPSWRLHSGMNHVQVPKMATKVFFQNLKESFSVFFVFKPNVKSIATLLSIHIPGKTSPLLSLTINPRSKKLVFSYMAQRSLTFPQVRPNLRAEKSDSIQQSRVHGQVVHLDFPIPRDYLREWMWLSVSANSSTLVVFINCLNESYRELKRPPSFNFRDDSLIYFRQEPGMKRKFLGPIQVARLFTTQLTTRPWICSTEGAPMLSDIMLRDQTSPNGCDVQTTRLRDEVHYLQDVTLTLRKEKRDLVHRIDHLLELCVCKAQCMYDGNIYVEGEQIYPDPCTVCECQGGRVTCRILTNRPECVDPCISNPCINGGHCHGKLGNRNFSCDCPPMYTGKHCEFHINCCVYPRTDGACVEEEMRWYFNIVNNQCEKVIYSGCGVSPNNFLTLSECEHTCRYGACCFRSKGLPKVTEPVKPYVECKPHTFDECQRLHLEEIEYEVVAFHPGATCNQEECNPLPVGFV